MQVAEQYIREVGSLVDHRNNGKKMHGELAAALMLELQKKKEPAKRVTIPLTFVLETVFQC